MPKLIIYFNCRIVCCIPNSTKKKRKAQKRQSFIQPGALGREPGDASQRRAKPDSAPSTST